MSNRYQRILLDMQTGYAVDMPYSGIYSIGRTKACDIPVPIDPQRCNLSDDIEVLSSFFDWLDIPTEKLEGIKPYHAWLKVGMNTDAYVEVLDNKVGRTRIQDAVDKAYDIGETPERLNAGCWLMLGDWSLAMLDEGGLRENDSKVKDMMSIIPSRRI